jgi:UDP-N-acetyl-D-glucosamine dehydrogenase
MSEALLERFRSRTATVAVVGLGYVGLPLVRAFAEAGFKCVGFDTDNAKIERLARGESYIGHVASEWIASAVEGRSFLPAKDVGQLAAADAIVLCVPTPLKDGREPDLSFVESTARQVGSVMRAGQLIVLESTTYPGTTRNIVMPLLAENSRLVCGRDFWLAYSPEREDPGNPSFGTRQIPKVVGGIDDTSRRLAEALYGAVVKDVVPVKDCETAEACKLLENIYRAVNIAMVNELKIVFDRLGINIWDVIAAAKTKPFGFQPFYPGPGMGGHCIPIDPFYLSWLARQHGTSAKFIELAGEVNADMPGYVLRKTEEALQSHSKDLRGAKVLLLGVAYKKDIDDPRESPGFVLIEQLQAAGAEISYHDPFIPRLPSMRHYDVPPLESVPLTADVLRACDAAIIVTDHSAVDYAVVVEHAPLVVDTRNATAPFRAGKTNVVLA